MDTASPTAERLEFGIVYKTPEGQVAWLKSVRACAYCSWSVAMSSARFESAVVLVEKQVLLCRTKCWSASRPEVKFRLLKD